jgi:hypothetical protein
MTVLSELEKAAALRNEYGSDAYDRELRKLKVLKCREMKALSFCSECGAYLDCEILKQFLRDVAQGGSDGSGPVQPSG